MKDKDVKKLLREQSARVLPDEKVKTNIKRELNIAQEEHEYALAHGGTQSGRNNRKQLILITAAIVLAIALTLGILIPVFLHKNSPSFPGGNNLGKFEQIQSAEDFYVFGAASVGSLLAAQSENRTAATASIRTLATRSFSVQTLDSTYGNDQQIVIDTVNGYMTLVEGLLSDGNIAHSQPQTPSDPADAQLYQYQTTISYQDLLGNSINFILCYNEVQTNLEHDDEEKEEEFAIEGVLRIGSGATMEEYAIRGERETETESDETEDSLQFTAYREGKPYIRMEQETEQEEGESEQKYSYTYYDIETGKVTERTVVEYEEESGELELLVKVEKENGEKDELLFRNGQQKNSLNVRAKLGNGDDIFFTIYIEQGKYRYSFSDGSSFDDGRYNDDDDDDEDDEEEDDDDDHRRSDRNF